jgi:thioredoxin 1
MQSLPSKPRRVEKPKVMLEAAIAILLLVSVGPPGCEKTPDPAYQSRDPVKQAVRQGDSTPPAGTGLPRLLDLGAGKCIPCKKMAPILEELKEEYAGSLEVVFIDVWQDHSAGEKYGIRSIPTQIFYDPSGKELFRHEGFFAKEDILAKWKELGVDVRKKDQ